MTKKNPEDSILEILWIMFNTIILKFNSQELKSFWHD